jgi:hypothetical protein
MLLRVRDESPAGRNLGEVAFEVPDAISLRDLIKVRVREEVAKHNAAPTGTFRGLVQPDGPSKRRLDWEKQAEVALRAFSKGGFFVVVGNRQIDDLDAQLDLSEASDVAFVRLVPLVGG